MTIGSPARRHAPLALALAAWLAAAGRVQAQDAFTEQWAEARSPGAGVLLYREQHLLRSRAGRARERVVLYRCAGGAGFARKLLDYGESLQAPAFSLDDRRAGYVEGLRRRDAGVELYSRARGDAKERVARLPVAPAVVDAGFDEFVRAHWASLLGGEALPLQFALPARGRALSFELQHLRRARVRGEQAEFFRLRLGGLLGLVAPRIDVAYATLDRRLLRFEGLTNLRAADGKRQLEARIDFPAPPRPVAEAAWQAARAEALVAACGSGQGPDK
jgi:hypothetical protein